VTVIDASTGKLVKSWAPPWPVLWVLAFLVGPLAWVMVDQGLPCRESVVLVRPNVRLSCSYGSRGRIVEVEGRPVWLCDCPTGAP
jgi:hypothetical protein